MARNVLAVRRWGNSRAVCIPVWVHRLLTWRVGDNVYATVENNCLILRPVTLPTGAVLQPEAESVTDGDSAGK